MLTLSENAKLLQALENERQELLTESERISRDLRDFQEFYIRQMRAYSNMQLGVLEKLAKIEETSCKLLKHVV